MATTVIEMMSLVVVAFSLTVLLAHVASIEGSPEDTMLDNSAWLRSYNEICDKDIYDQTKVEEQLIELAKRSPKHGVKKISKHLTKIALMREAKQLKSQLCTLKQMRKFRVLDDEGDACHHIFSPHKTNFLQFCIQFHSHRLTEQQKNENKFGQLSLAEKLGAQLTAWSMAGGVELILHDELIEFFERKLRVDLCKKEPTNKRRGRSAFEENYEKFIKKPCKYLFKETDEMYRFYEEDSGMYENWWLEIRELCSYIFKNQLKIIKSANEDLKAKCHGKS